MTPENALRAPRETRARAHIQYGIIGNMINNSEYDDQEEQVDLSEHYITDIRKICGFTNLMRLDMSQNCINRMDWIDRLYDLRELYLRYNDIDRICGLDRLTNLRVLDLEGNSIKKIEGLSSLINLQELVLNGNKIQKIEGLESLINLKELYLGHNKIQKIEGFESLINLKELDLEHNKIQKIEGLESLINLKELDLEHNKIQKIEGLECLINLKGLELAHNEIRKIEGIDCLINLKELELSENDIQKIEGFDRLVVLESIELSDNPIKEVPMTIMNLTNLKHLHVEVEINPIIQRFLSRNMIRSKEQKHTIYTDQQNVHDSQINNQITKSLYRLMEEKISLSKEQTMEEIINDPTITKQVKEQIVEYCRIPDVHSKLNVTFMEALQTVWQIIQKHDQSVEIKKIFNQEMQDSICRCFTGRLSRLVNCLCGFDPRVVVQISENQEIANLIISIRQKYDQLDQQIEMVRKEMTERGYDRDTIDLWIGYLE
jgi:Leucine-rich repeat (LRR) protein